MYLVTSLCSNCQCSHIDCSFHSNSHPINRPHTDSIGNIVHQIMEFSTSQSEINIKAICITGNSQISYSYNIVEYKSTIKTHDSESRGQEETAIIRETKNTRPLSELFTRKSVKKLTNALVKPPYALSLSYHRLSTFLLHRINKPRIVEISTFVIEYQPMRV